MRIRPGKSHIDNLSRSRLLWASSTPLDISNGISHNQVRAFAPTHYSFLCRTLKYPHPAPTCYVSLTLLRLKLLESCNELLPEICAESKTATMVSISPGTPSKPHCDLHSLSRNASVRSTLLVAAVLAHKVADSVDLETTKYVFGPRSTTVVWREPLITDVYVSSSSCTSCAALSRGSSSPVTASAASTTKSCAPLASLVLRLREEDTPGA
jgi:hypothetical protein